MLVGPPIENAYDAPFGFCFVVRRNFKGVLGGGWCIQVVCVGEQFVHVCRDYVWIGAVNRAEGDRAEKNKGLFSYFLCGRVTDRN